MDGPKLNCTKHDVHNNDGAELILSACVIMISVAIIVSRGQTLYSRRALSIIDDKRPRYNALEQFTGSSGTATSVVVMGVNCIVVF